LYTLRSITFNLEDNQFCTVAGIDPIIPPNNDDKFAEIKKLEGAIGIIDTDLDIKRITLAELNKNISLKEEELDASSKYLHIQKTEEKRAVVQGEILSISAVLDQLKKDVNQTKAG